MPDEAPEPATNRGPAMGRASRAFERLRARAERGHKYAEYQVHKRPTSDDIISARPEDITLTTAEIETADEILKFTIGRFNMIMNSSMSYISFSEYRRKNEMTTPDYGVWGAISESSRLVMMWCNMAMTQLDGLQDIFDSNVLVNNWGEITMRDKFQTGQAGAVGPNANASETHFSNVWQAEGSTLNLPSLAADLKLLRAQMKLEASEGDHDIAVAHIANAEKAASSGDGVKTLGYLKEAGKWAWDVATKIGVGSAIAAIKIAS